MAQKKMSPVNSIIQSVLLVAMSMAWLSMFNGLLEGIPFWLKTSGPIEIAAFLLVTVAVILTGAALVLRTSFGLKVVVPVFSLMALIIMLDISVARVYYAKRSEFTEPELNGIVQSIIDTTARKPDGCELLLKEGPVRVYGKKRTGPFKYRPLYRGNSSSQETTMLDSIIPPWFQAYADSVDPFWKHFAATEAFAEDRMKNLGVREAQFLSWQYPDYIFFIIDTTDMTSPLRMCILDETRDKSPRSIQEPRPILSDLLKHNFTTRL